MKSGRPPPIWGLANRCQLFGFRFFLNYISSADFESINNALEIGKLLRRIDDVHVPAFP